MASDVVGSFTKGRAKISEPYSPFKCLKNENFLNTWKHDSAWLLTHETLENEN